MHRYLFLDFFDVAVLVDFDLISFDFSCDFFTFLVQSRLNYYLHYLKGMIICEVFFLLADESVFLMDCKRLEEVVDRNHEFFPIEPGLHDFKLH